MESCSTSWHYKNNMKVYVVFSERHSRILSEAFPGSVWDIFFCRKNFVYSNLCVNHNPLLGIGLLYWLIR